MKFAKCMYSSFESGNLGLRLKYGDIFAVTPPIENSEIFKRGIETHNFIIVSIDNDYQFESKVVNITTDLRYQWKNEQLQKEIAAKKTLTPAPKIATPLDKDKAFKSEEVAYTAKTISGMKPDKPKEVELPAPQVEEVINEPEPAIEPETPAMSFTEIAGNVKNALEAIAKCNDIKMLEHAKATDSRKTIQAAIRVKMIELNKK